MSDPIEDVYLLLKKATDGQAHRICRFKDLIILIFSPNDPPVVIEVKELK